jgi:predicted Zn-dependent peptidase
VLDFSSHNFRGMTLAQRAAMVVDLLLMALLVGLTAEATASEYDPPGLYDVDYFKLENGLDVVLKKRTHARNVAVRLVVNVGQRNFPCDKRETPHFLEHLLFMGTSKHTEAELKSLIEDHGGSWNGFTSATETVYQVDIFDKYLPLAIDTLHEILTDTSITPQRIESARAVIHRERSGNHSKLFRWLYENGIGKPAVAKAGELLLPGVICPGLITPDGISEADVQATYKDYYVPTNMTLVVVGNFDRSALVSQVKSTFGRLARRASNGSKIVKPPYTKGTMEVTGTLAPLLGSDTQIGFAYRTEGSDSPDYYALSVLGRYLNRVIYEKIRVDKALSYGPGASYVALKDYGIFVAVADVNLDRVELAKALLDEELENLREGRIKAEVAQAAEQSILMGFAQSYESNSSIAGLYVQTLDQLKSSKGRRPTSHKASVASITPQDLQRVANKYLRNDARVIVRSTPTLTFTQFYIGLGVFAVTIPGAGFYFVRRFVRRRRSRIRKASHGQTKGEQLQENEYA